MISLFDTPEKKAAKTYVHNLIRMAAADNVLHRDEIILINKIGSQKGLNEKEINSLYKLKTDGKITIPKSRTDCFDLLYDIIEVMNADGEVSEAEFSFCEEVAQKMGFSETIVKLLVNKIERSITYNVPKQTLVEEARPFINY